MRQKLKPDYDSESIQSDLIETVCFLYSSGKSVRAVGKEMDISPMKVRKILITANAYSTDLSTEIGELYHDGKTVGEIAEMLNMTPANVNSYLPYERIIYNMDEKSVGADRQQRYRDRLRAASMSTSDTSSDTELDSVAEVGEIEMTKVPIERMRTKTLIIVIGRKLRKLIPADALDDSSDPLARENSYTWGSNVGGVFTLHEPADPDKMIWCAELTSSGRGAKKRSGIVLMSANCGFAVIAPIPQFAPTNPEQPTREELKTYRAQLENLMIDAIRRGFLDFCLPSSHVLDYTDTVRRVELVKGRPSFPQTRLEELIERELKWKDGADPMTAFNVRGNWTSRKFGNGDYRHVEKAVMNMLEMSEREKETWLDEFLKPMREPMSGQAADE